MRIGQLAEAAHTRPSTLRYYEQRGLLRPPTRNSSGYRDYPRSTATRLAFIARARTAGLTLSEIAAVLAIRDAGTAPCIHVRDLLDQKIADLDRTIEELQLLRASIHSLRARATDIAAQACTPESICNLL
jgi:DNA-binding transcriptional MerR regulator